MEFQTRSEENGLTFHLTMNDALNYAKLDETIWKISFTIPVTNERIRLVKESIGWVLETVYGDR